MATDDLRAELRALYLGAGQPSFRRISNAINDDGDLPDKVSHETVSGLLNGTTIPRWSKVESVVRMLIAMSVHGRDPDLEVRRFLALWTSSTDQRIAALGATMPAASASPLGELSGVIEPANGLVPARNYGFTGRDDLLEVMRARLEGEPWQPLVVHGLSGVGKTSMAAEFVHREMRRFDVVWWIVAEQAARARSTLVALGDRLPLDLEISQSDMRQTVNNVLRALEQADFTWLIVFDNATAPEEIHQLLPMGRGAVIVTTRDSSWSSYGRTLPVGVLNRRESIALLQSRRGLSFDEADRLADCLGDLPLALEQASAMLPETGISVDEYLRRLDRQAASVLSEGRPADYPRTVAGAFSLTFDEVRRVSPGAAQLLGMLSCMSAEPVSPALLGSVDERDIPPPLGRVLAQDTQLEAAIQLIERFGLLTTLDGGQRIQVHRLVQLVVRDLLSDHDRTAAYRNARRLLVAVNPGQPDDPLTWEMHAQIGPHIGPARVLDDPGTRTRRVVLDQMRYLYVVGDFDGCLRLGATARRAWASPDGALDDETVECLDRYGLALVGLGRYKEAGALYEEAWVRLNTHPSFGPNSDLTARIANGVSIVSRILGNYGKALNLERYRAEHYERRADPDDAEMLLARGNQAVCYRALGDFAKAYEIDEALVERRRRALGEDDYRTQFTLSNLARDLYGLGRYADALRLQEDGLAVLREQLNSRHPSVLLAERTVTVALRKLGRVAEALAASRRHFLTCQGEWGSDHGHTLAAAMTYANAIRVAVAAGSERRLTFAHAYNASLRAVNTYRGRFGETNPLTLAAATNHAIILRAMGERNTARRTCESAYRLLLEQLGPTHPYTRAAAVGFANDLANGHERDGAIRVLSSTVENARSAGRDDHPDMMMAAVNLRLLVDDPDPDLARRGPGASLDALREILGADHPQVLAANRGELGECDVEPPPF